MEIADAPSDRITGEEVTLARMVREVLLLAVIVLAPFKRDLTLWALPGGGNDHYQRIGLRAFHLPLALLVALVAWEVLRRRPRIDSNHAKLALATAAWFFLCFLVSPSWRGVDFLVHVLAGVAIWHSTVTAGARGRTHILVAVVGLGVFEAILGIGQFLRGGTLGIALVEVAGWFHEFGGGVAVRGSLTYHHHLAGLLLISAAAAFTASALSSRGRLANLLCLSLVPLGVALPMTYSRAAILAVASMGLVLVLRHWSRLRFPILAWSTGLVLGLAVAARGWLERAQQSARVGGVGHGIDNGRLDLSRDALELAQGNPSFGVGPGNYVPHLRELLGVAGNEAVKVASAHNIVAHSAVEAGVLGGILVLVLLGALAVWTWQGGSMRTVAVLSLLYFQLLDRFPYTFQFGFVMSGLWLGIAHIAGRPAARHEDPVTGPPEPPLDVGP